MTAPRAIDLTHYLDRTTPVFPGDPPIAIDVIESTRDVRPDGQRALNSSRVTLGVHAGTHMDAPFHFFEDGRTIDQIALDQCVGPAVLVKLANGLRNGQIVPGHFAAYREQLQQLRKVIVHTGWSEKWGKPEYFTDHPVFTCEAAEFLVRCGVQLVGVDFPSVDRPPFPAHLAFLGSGTLIVENLTNLAAIPGDVFQLVVLPLKITGRDGSPVRAIALEVT